MGHQIIKQPNGLYCLFSSVVDAFILLDATPQDIIDEWVNDYREQVTEKVKRIVSELETGGKPYHQFTMSFAEAVDSTIEHCGADCESIVYLIDEGILPAVSRPQDAPR